MKARPIVAPSSPSSKTDAATQHIKNLYGRIAEASGAIKDLQRVVLWALIPDIAPVDPYELMRLEARLFQALAHLVSEMEHAAAWGDEIGAVAGRDYYALHVAFDLEEGNSPLSQADFQREVDAIALSRPTEATQLQAQLNRRYGLQ